MDALVHRGKCPETWMEDILQMGREGKTFVHVINYLNISRDTFYRLKERDKKFLDTVNRFKELSEQWWIDIAHREWIQGNSKSINSNHWSLLMRNMFKDDWSDRKDYDIKTDGKPITNDNKIQVEILGLDKEKEEE